MRKLVAGTDDEGRSCLVDDVELSIDRDVAPGLAMTTIFRGGEVLQSAPTPRWSLVEWGPGAEYELHATATGDLIAVLDGGGDLLLDDGAHAFTAGDVIVLTGEKHGWRMGPDGCRMSIVVIHLTSA
jgi:quercetin dioxygenase-like cupin family protein